MIDERHEELAALYVFDLLEGAERAQFETALAGDAALQSLVRELREASSALAHASATPPPPALRARVLASLGDRPGHAPLPAATVAHSNVIRPAPSVFRAAMPWAAAACFAALAVVGAQRYFALNGEAALLRNQQALAEITLQSVRQQLEAERIVGRRQVEDLDQRLKSATTQLTQAQTDLANANNQLAAAAATATDRARALADAEGQLAGARTQLAERERQVAALTQRVDALAGASAEIGRQLGEAKERIAKLTDEMKLQRDLADFKITVLASLAKDNPQALAVAVWDPSKKEGVLKVEKLPALRPNQDYQLWVVDPQYKDPVDGGVFTVDPKTGEARISFKAKQPVQAVNAFAISRERKGGVPKAEGPIVLLGK